MGSCEGVKKAWTYREARYPRINRGTMGDNRGMTRCRSSHSITRFRICEFAVNYSGGLALWNRMIKKSQNRIREKAIPAISVVEAIQRKICLSVT